MLDSFTDDQIAQLGCLGAFLVAGVVMTFSYWLGSARKQAAQREAAIIGRGTIAASNAARAAIMNAPRRKAA